MEGGAFLAFRNVFRKMIFYAGRSLARGGGGVNAFYHNARIL